MARHHGRGEHVAEGGIARIERPGLAARRRGYRRQHPCRGLGGGDQAGEHREIDEESPGQGGQGETRESQDRRQGEKRVERQGMVEKMIEIDRGEARDGEARDGHRRGYGPQGEEPGPRPGRGGCRLVAGRSTLPELDGREADVDPALSPHPEAPPDRILRTGKPGPPLCTTIARSVRLSRIPMKRTMA